VNAEWQAIMIPTNCRSEDAPLAAEGRMSSTRADRGGKGQLRVELRGLMRLGGLVGRMTRWMRWRVKRPGFRGASSDPGALHLRRTASGSCNITRGTAVTPGDFSHLPRHVGRTQRDDTCGVEAGATGPRFHGERRGGTWKRVELKLCHGHREGTLVGAGPLQCHRIVADSDHRKVLGQPPKEGRFPAPVSSDAVPKRKWSRLMSTQQSFRWCCPTSIV